MLKTPLTLLVEDLVLIEKEHEEVGDTAVREAMFESIQSAFVVPKADYAVPDDFEMFSKEANRKVKAALSKFLSHPEVTHAASVLKTPQERLDAFQDPIETAAGNTQEEFFGYAEMP